MAIQNMREVSCVEFEDISPFIKNYMKNYTIAIVTLFFSILYTFSLQLHLQRSLC